MTQTANLENLKALHNVEAFGQKYLDELGRELSGMTVRDYLKRSIKSHTAGNDEDALSLAKQEGTWDDYSDLELAKIDLGLNFNHWYYEEGTTLMYIGVLDYVTEGVYNI